MRDAHVATSCAHIWRRHPYGFSRKSHRWWVTRTLSDVKLANWMTLYHCVCGSWYHGVSGLAIYVSNQFARHLITQRTHTHTFYSDRHFHTNTHVYAYLICTFLCVYFIDLLSNVPCVLGAECFCCAIRMVVEGGGRPINDRTQQHCGFIILTEAFSLCVRCRRRSDTICRWFAYILWAVVVHASRVCLPSTCLH